MPNLKYLVVNALFVLIGCVNEPRTVNGKYNLSVIKSENRPESGDSIEYDIKTNRLLHSHRKIEINVSNHARDTVEKSDIRISENAFLELDSIVGNSRIAELNMKNHEQLGGPCPNFSTKYTSKRYLEFSLGGVSKTFTRDSCLVYDSTYLEEFDKLDSLVKE